MQKIKITFDVLPYIAEMQNEAPVTIERHSHTHDNTEKIVKAANMLGATKIEITEAD